MSSWRSQGDQALVREAERVERAVRYSGWRSTLAPGSRVSLPGEAGPVTVIDASRAGKCGRAGAALLELSDGEKVTRPLADLLPPGP